MDEELKDQELISAKAVTETSVKEETKQTLDSLPRIEELRRSEQDVKVNTEVQGATQVRQKTQVKDFIFKKKSDKRKIYFKKIAKKC